MPFLNLSPQEHGPLGKLVRYWGEQRNSSGQGEAFKEATNDMVVFTLFLGALAPHERFEVFQKIATEFEIDIVRQLSGPGLEDPRDQVDEDFQEMRETMRKQIHELGKDEPIQNLAVFGCIQMVRKMPKEAVQAMIVIIAQHCNLGIRNVPPNLPWSLVTTAPPQKPSQGQLAGVQTNVQGATLSPKGMEIVETICEWLDKLPPGHAEAGFAKIAAAFDIELGIFPEELPDAVMVDTATDRMRVSDVIQAAIREMNEQLDPMDQHEVVKAIAMVMDVPILDDAATKH